MLKQISAIMTASLISVGTIASSVRAIDSNDLPPLRCYPSGLCSGDSQQALLPSSDTDEERGSGRRDVEAREQPYVPPIDGGPTTTVGQPYV